MLREGQGRYIVTSTVGERVRAYLPAPLPPSPPIEWTPDLRERFDRALLALGRLDSVSMLLPETGLFLYSYIRKEAVLSSQIEGTQSSLSDLLLFELEELPGVPLDDVQEVSNYVAALTHGLRRLAEGFPLFLRLLREIHGVLLEKGRGSDRDPGEFRRSQNWIGGTRPGNAAFVPPPPADVVSCMADLELFLHDQPERTSPLLKAALAHVQFETIHPFFDGNGRLGRLLITLNLYVEGVLAKPLLYLSLYFKTHRAAYYSQLNNVRQTGDWESWLAFIADAATATASEAVETARRLVAQAEADRRQIARFGRIANSALRVLSALQERPITSAAAIVDSAGMSHATVNVCLRAMEEAGLISEMTGKRRNRLYGYKNYVRILSEGTERAPGHGG